MLQKTLHEPKFYYAPLPVSDAERAEKMADLLNAKRRNVSKLTWFLIIVGGLTIATGIDRALYAIFKAFL